MNKRMVSLLLALLLVCGLFAGCGGTVPADTAKTAAEEALTLIEGAESDASETISDSVSGILDAIGEAKDEGALSDTDALEDLLRDTEEELSGVLSDLVPDPEGLEEAVESAMVDEDGEYTGTEDVALYLHLYGHLPSNFITKSEARALGWDNSQGNLWDVAPGKSIGGDYFGNYEGILPDGRYHECDVNYAGGYRGAERLIYGDDGSIYYTNDHYNSFEQLY